MTDLILPRRKFLAGAAAFLAAPAIVRVASLMPVKAERRDKMEVQHWVFGNPGTEPPLWVLTGRELRRIDAADLRLGSVVFVGPGHVAISS